MNASSAASLLVATLLALPPLADAAPAYRVEDIPTPAGVVPECGGIDFLPDGRLVAAFHHGEVFTYEPASKVWKQFGEGLHDPMGVLAVSEREIIAVQRAELTRLTDEDGDGVADRYDSICDGWGVSGNYHEFACTPARDSEGNFYVSLGNGSNASIPRFEVRGAFNPDGFGSKSHFSCVPWRGWVIRISPSGQITPIACGFRQPNGLLLDPAGALFVTDNQGDWVGTSKLHHVQPGRFYGHAPSLVWRDDFKKGRSVDDLDRLRTEGAVLFPHAIVANSPGQPVIDKSSGKFGPFSGQMIVPEHNIPRLLRVMLETVHGEMQGAVATLYEGAPMRPGTHRLAFAPDGSLWCAQSERKLGWPAGAGIQRVTWTGETPMDVAAVHLTETGFSFQFTKALDHATVTGINAIEGRRYYYEYHEEYGSPQTDIHPVQIVEFKSSDDARQLSVKVDALEPGYIYEFTLRGIKASDGSEVSNSLICYTLNRLLDGRTAPLPRPAPTGESKGSGHDKPKG